MSTAAEKKTEIRGYNAVYGIGLRVFQALFIQKEWLACIDIISEFCYKLRWVTL
jgi:hypothetical protein